VTDAFLDTNVLVYLLSSDLRKAERSTGLLAAGGVASVQVLNEFVSVAIRKHALSWSELKEVLLVFRETLRIEPLTLDTHDRAVELARRYGFRIYDASILAAAELAGCDTVYSEDMQDGQVIGVMTIRNPFAAVR
jgi:predicted nucleic acid-binding protein